MGDERECDNEDNNDDVRMFLRVGEMVYCKSIICTK